MSQGHSKTYFLDSPKAFIDPLNDNLLYSPKGYIPKSPNGKGEMADFLN